MSGANPFHPLTLDMNPTDQELDIVEAALENYSRDKTSGKKEKSSIEINLVARNNEGQIAGGISASTELGLMNLEVLWVDPGFREMGLGQSLVSEAERQGREAGCQGSQTMTFDFQAPDFYQGLGYKLLGTYDGYPHGIKEFILGKRFSSTEINNRTVKHGPLDSFTLSNQPTAEEMNLINQKLIQDFWDNVGRDRVPPRLEINLVMKDQNENIAGGLIAGTVIQNLVLEAIWIKEGHRGHGYGKALLKQAEKIAREYGCPASQTYSFNFQAPGFFEKMGYQTYGISDNYPTPFVEYYYIKKYP